MFTTNNKNAGNRIEFLTPKKTEIEKTLPNSQQHLTTNKSSKESMVRQQQSCSKSGQKQYRASLVAGPLDPSVTQIITMTDEQSAGMETRGGHSQPTIATTTTNAPVTHPKQASSPKQAGVGAFSTTNSTTRRNNAENSGSMSTHQMVKRGTTVSSTNGSRLNGSSTSARKRKSSAVSLVRDSKAKAAEILSKIPCKETKIEPVKTSSLVVQDNLNEDDQDEMGDAGKDANKSSGLKRIAKQVIDII